MFITCLLGPVIKAEVGDTIIVTFMNQADRAYSIQPHGVYFTKEFDATNYVDGKLMHGYLFESSCLYTCALILHYYRLG